MSARLIRKHQGDDVKKIKYIEIYKILFLSIYIVLCGCSTIKTHSSENHQEIRPYIGTSTALKKAEEAWNKEQVGSGLPDSNFLDVMASFIADTIIIPYDLYQYFKNHK